MRKIINHKWECPECGILIGEDYEECTICKYKKIEREIIKEKVALTKGYYKILPVQSRRYKKNYRKIMAMKFGLPPFKKKYTLKSIGEKIGMTRQAVFIAVNKSLDLMNNFRENDRKKYYNKCHYNSNDRSTNFR